jgi:hypothetical protein
MRERRGAYNRVLVGKPEEKRALGRTRRRWMILRWIFRKLDGGHKTELIWLRIGISGRHLSTRQ